MKYLSIILLLSLLFISASAKESSGHILITKTSKKSNLSIIKNRLDSINVKMFVRKSNSAYYVYSGKYNSDNSAEYALKNIKKYFPSALIIKNKPKTSQAIRNTKEASGFFIGVALGTDNVTSNYESQSGVSYTIESGYYFNENIFMTVGYLNSSTSDIDVNNIYTSLNYKLRVAKNIEFYTGVLGGYSTLELTDFEVGEASTSMLLGVQIGTSYNFYKDISTYIAYQGLYLDHIIEIEDASKLEFNIIHNLQLGIQYKF